MNIPVERFFVMCSYDNERYEPENPMSFEDAEDLAERLEDENPGRVYAVFAELST